MADLCVTAGCGDLEPAPTVEITANAHIIRIGEDVRAANEKLEAHVKDIKFKIHRFPAKLRGFGSDMDYIAPSIVAIGPYYHGVHELQAMEEVKRMAVYYFCEELADSPEEVYRKMEEVYRKILPVACDVRGCYADVDALERITDEDFAAMMFYDGCFLVQCMKSLFSLVQSPFTSVIRSKGRDSILRDMMLLENQIPWPVLQLLTDIKSMGYFFIYDLISGFRVSWSPGEQSGIDKNFKPPHLLGLIHHQVSSSNVKKESRIRWKNIIIFGFLRKLHRPRPGKAVPCSGSVERITFIKRKKLLKEKIIKRKKEKRVDELTVTTSAAELAEIGVKLTPNGTTQFSDMKIVRGPLFATLSLAPLLLDDLTACWLVNMVAFEQCTGALLEADYPINSYLSVMAQLMNRNDDVRELHGKRIVHTIFDDNQTLKFFKRLAPRLTEDDSYLDIFEGLLEYKQKRWVWIAIYKFLYNNSKTIATVLSIVGVLVGIFKTIFSLKQHQP